MRTKSRSKSHAEQHYRRARVRGGACPFSASSISSLHLRHSRVPQIQTNSSGSYRQSNKCRTFTFSSEGLAVPRESPPSPTHSHPVTPTSSALFDDVSLSFVHQSNPRSLPHSCFPAHGSFASGNEGTRVRDLYYVQLPCTARSQLCIPGFSALANFSLLNVNFDVIDGTSIARLNAIIFLVFLPFHLTISYSYKIISTNTSSSLHIHVKRFVPIKFARQIKKMLFESTNFNINECITSLNILLPFKKQITKVRLHWCI